MLNNSIGSISKLKEVLDECKRLGINVLKPSINESISYYKIYKKHYHQR